MRTGAARIAALLGAVVAVALCAAVPARAADPFYGMLTTDLDTPGALRAIDAAAHAGSNVTSAASLLGITL